MSLRTALLPCLGVILQGKRPAGLSIPAGPRSITMTSFQRCLLGADAETQLSGPAWPSLGLQHTASRCSCLLLSCWHLLHVPLQLVPVMGRSGDPAGFSWSSAGPNLTLQGGSGHTGCGWCPKRLTSPAATGVRAGRWAHARAFLGWTSPFSAWPRAADLFVLESPCELGPGSTLVQERTGREKQGKGPI